MVVLIFFKYNVCFETFYLTILEISFMEATDLVFFNFVLLFQLKKKFEIFFVLQYLND